MESQPGNQPHEAAALRCAQVIISTSPANASEERNELEWPARYRTTGWPSPGGVGNSLDSVSRRRPTARPLTGRGRGLVLDVGAYEGAFAAGMRSRWDATVWAIEPIPVFADALERRFSEDESVHVIGVALGGDEGIVEISLADDGSSAWINDAVTVEVRQRDVAQVVADDPVALLKVSAEGAELDVLDRIIATGQISQIRCIQV